MGDDGKKGGILLDALAWAAVLPVLLTPVANPDLFWHLSAAERLLAGGLPLDDSFSFTRMGWPWMDFEWLVQLLYLGVWRAAGWWGLWGLKALLMALCGLGVWGLAELYGERGAARRGALLAWGAASLARSELKPELLSILLFTAELWVLEAHRLGRWRESSAPRWALVSAAFCAFWANLHPGFAAGLALCALYAAGRSRGERAVLLAALGGGACGALLNPYGWGIYGVLFEHALWMPVVSRHVLEWMPLLPSNPYHWPVYLLMAACAGAWLLRRPSAGAPPAAHLAAGAFFGVWSLLHARQAAYFIPVAALILLESPAVVRLKAPAAWAGCVLYAAFVGWMALPDLRRVPFDERLFPAEAAGFVEAHLGVMGHRRIYNEWGWGGYLGRRFGAGLRVFMDGRYLFHPLLAEAAKANATPEAWGALLDKYGVEWALLLNRPGRMTLLRPAREGEEPFLVVPHFELYMPRERWALVHEDPLARIYIRRGAFPEAWVRRLESACGRRP